MRLSVLTRYLNKTDFGQIALILFVLGIIELFTDLGMTAAIIHKKDITKSEYSSLYWMNILLGICLYLAILLISPILSEYYMEDALNSLLPIMGIQVLIASIGRQFRTIEHKKMNFKFISTVDIISALISLLSAVILAIKGFGVYSLVYSSIIVALFKTCAYFFSGIKANPIVFHFSYPELKPFLKIGIYHTGGQMVNYLNKEIDILIVGSVLGVEKLGIYNLAKRLVFNPLRMINPILVKIATPLFAIIQESRTNLAGAFFKLNIIVSSINLPIYIFIIIFASPIVSLIYGDDYLEIIPLVQILSVYTFSLSLRNPLGTITIAAGRTDLELLITSISFIIMPMVIYISSLHSIEMLCFALTISSIMIFIPTWRLVVHKILDVSFYEYAKSFVPDYRLLYSNIRRLISL